MTKSSGPRTEPWGTPHEEVCQEDRSVSHFTRKQRDDRYDLNQHGYQTRSVDRCHASVLVSQSLGAFYGQPKAIITVGFLCYA